MTQYDDDIKILEADIRSTKDMGVLGYMVTLPLVGSLIGAGTAFLASLPIYSITDDPSNLYGAPAVAGLINIFVGIVSAESIQGSELERKANKLYHAQNEQLDAPATKDS
jgi:hypothetical protein